MSGCGEALGLLTVLRAGLRPIGMRVARFGDGARAHGDNRGSRPHQRSSLALGSLLLRRVLLLFCSNYPSLSARAKTVVLELAERPGNRRESRKARQAAQS
jgi:hypothetical protein